MDTGERLAAYLSGDLSADERASLEAELARDARLRTRLDAIRRVDALLSSLPPVGVPPEASARLRQRVGHELMRAGPVDDLAVRRTRRARWFQGAAVATAAAAAVTMGIVVFANRDGGSGADPTALEADDGGGLEVVAEGNSYDADSISALARDVAVPLSEEDARAVYSNGGVTDQPSSAPSEPPTPGPSGTPPPAPAVPGDEPLGAESAPLAGADDPVERCRADALDGAHTRAILVYIELAEFDGAPAVIYILLAPDATSEYRRATILVLDALPNANPSLDCFPLHYATVQLSG